jgi:hypothetical protein
VGGVATEGPLAGLKSEVTFSVTVPVPRDAPDKNASDNARSSGTPGWSAEKVIKASIPMIQVVRLL